ncbi:DUF1641 domain-containing protein [Cohnella lupini]|uniref:Uncharacterized protein YjgD (DUF1641 family) n=1 Tax=Cohnella lupini TaxID=1294267 RepID=A0A3D9I2J2_9BACL|nr:DUF1641 domain-containing protein [Cohnella lupini]RED55974.1 uncharacterized protein YjgD (DUF1641 family) [Cohnella lupini]
MSNTPILESEQGALAAEAKGTADLLNQLSKPEVQEALSLLITQLPKLAEISAQITKTYDLAQKVLSDRVLIADTAKSIKELAIPIEKKAKEFASAAIEANDRAEQSNETIGLFGMLKLLKNPELQRMLRFGQAYLDIMGERKQ